MHSTTSEIVSVPTLEEDAPLRIAPEDVHQFLENASWNLDLGSSYLVAGSEADVKLGKVRKALTELEAFVKTDAGMKMTLKMEDVEGTY